MQRAKLLLVTVVAAIIAPEQSRAIDLRPETVDAWDRYVQSANSRIHDRLDSHQPFLWIDESPGRMQRLQRGEILVAPVTGHGTQSVPDGLIHDWIGAAFIPNATIESLLAVVHDYDRYKDLYKPVVTDSKLLACAATDREFSMVWQRHVLFVNAAMEGRYRVHDFAIDGRRGYTVAGTTQIQEIQDYRRASERLMPPDRGNGFIWRLHSIARYEERDGGVYLELEALALTRDIPLPSIGWFIPW